VPISIDTTRAEVARRAVAAGASLINDISGLTMDPAMAPAAAELAVPVVLNHIRGVPKTMQGSPAYEHVVLEVLVELAGRVRSAREAGIAPSRIIVDPGIGFGKKAEHNLALLRHLRALRALEAPILAGVSRKSFLGTITGRPVTERGSASIAAEILAALGGAEIIRTHAPAATVDALKVVQAFHEPPVTH
jgi:dihydropteroate synthase